MNDIKKYTSIAEDLGWLVHPYEDGSFGLENWSPAGENLIISASGKSFLDDVRAYVYGYDTDEHIEELSRLRLEGNNDVPPIRVLVGDADEIRDMYDKLLDALEGAE